MENRVEFDRGVEEESTVRQSDARHPRADFRADIWERERPIYDPETRG